MDLFLVQENPGSGTDRDCSVGSMLLYVNVIKNLALALEMSAIGGKNAANLAVHFVKRRGITIERESAGRKKLN